MHYTKCYKISRNFISYKRQEHLITKTYLHTAPSLDKLHSPNICPSLSIRVEDIKFDMHFGLIFRKAMR